MTSLIDQAYNAILYSKESIHYYGPCIEILKTDNDYDYSEIRKNTKFKKRIPIDVKYKPMSRYSQQMILSDQTDSVLKQIILLLS